MWRILRKLAAGDFENLGDISTLLNPEVVDEIKNMFSIVDTKVHHILKQFRDKGAFSN